MIEGPRRAIGEIERALTIRPQAANPQP